MNPLSLSYLQAMLTQGEYVALNLAKYSDHPLIGRITDVQGRDVTVEWMVGTYSGQWREWKGREGGKSVVYSDIVKPTDIVRRGIKFTRSKKLSLTDIKELKAVYDI